MVYWEKDIIAHTSQKHRILDSYLHKWFPILGKWNKRLAYIDGFAGRGTYSRGEPGSPIIALRAASKYVHKMSLKVDFWFIEKNKKTAQDLESKIRGIYGRPSERLNYRVEHSTFGLKFPAIVRALESEGSMPPTFAFIDPYGYSDIKMKTLLGFLENKKCEIFVTLMSSKLARFLEWSNVTHGTTVDELFGNSEWRNICSSGRRRVNDIVDLYVSQLDLGENRHVKFFDMYDKNQFPIYSLIFTTNHKKGLNAMTYSMGTAGIDADCQFFDANAPDQTGIRQYVDKSELRRHPTELIFDEFCGTSVRVGDVETFVNRMPQTIFDKKLLVQMAKDTPPKILGAQKRDGRPARRFTYPAGCTITFADKHDQANAGPARTSRCDRTLEDWI